MVPRVPACDAPTLLLSVLLPGRIRAVTCRVHTGMRSALNILQMCVSVCVCVLTVSLASGVIFFRYTLAHTYHIA